MKGEESVIGVRDDLKNLQIKSYKLESAYDMPYFKTIHKDNYTTFTLLLDIQLWLKSCLLFAKNTDCALDLEMDAVR